MLILDLTNVTFIKKSEVLKITLHSIKVCLIFNWTLILKFNKGCIKITPLLFQKALKQRSRLVVILKPYSRLNFSAVSEFIEIGNNIYNPTIVISDLIYLHDSGKLSYVHLPSYSPEIIKKFDYVKEVGAYICFTDWRDCGYEVLSSKLNRKFDYIKLSLPLKTIKKNHIYSEFTEIPKAQKTKMNYEFVEDFIQGKVTVIIPTALHAMPAPKVFNFPSGFINLINEISNILNLLNLEFEIIMVIGPEINQENLNEVLIRNIKLKCIRDIQNFNFSRRVNLGLEAAEYDLIWLLNDDVEVRENSSAVQDVKIAIEIANRKSTGFVGTFLLDEKNKINHAGIQIYKRIADHYLRGTLYEYEQAMNLFKVREVSGVTGANMFFTKNSIKKISPWDENYPNNFNDLEISLRAREHKLENYVIRTNSFIHRESETRDRRINETEKLITILGKYQIVDDEDSFKFTIPNCCLAKIEV